MTCLRRQPRAYLTCLPHAAHQTLRTLTASHADFSVCQRGADQGNATRGVASAIATLAALLLTIAVLASAPGHGEGLAYFRTRVGAEEGEARQIGSPFDYARQMRGKMAASPRTRTCRGAGRQAASTRARMV